MGIDGSQIKRRQEHTEKQPPPKKTKVRPRISGLPKIDCGACKAEGAMGATKTPRFGSFIRFIGYIFVIPSVLGVLFAILVFFSTSMATSDVMQQSSEAAFQTGAAIGGAMGIGFSLFIGASSLVGGLIGYLLLTKKKVFRCNICGYILDRA